MDGLRLVRPDEAMEAQAQEYVREHREWGESELHGSALLEQRAYADWLRLRGDNASPATVRPGWVVASTFFVVRQGDGRLIGMADIRHDLNDFLRKFGGHIGYGVRPSERRKGYGAQILQMALDYGAAIGLNRAMVACYTTNEASRRTILRCGGVLERENQQADGRWVQVYWITLGDTAAAGPACEVTGE